MLSYLADMGHSFDKSDKGLPRSVRVHSFPISLGAHSGCPERHGWVGGSPTSRQRALYPSMCGTSGIHVENCGQSWVAKIESV